MRYQRSDDGESLSSNDHLADPLCANIVETPASSLISEQGGEGSNLCW